MSQTTRVRIAVIIDDEGHYVAYGTSQYRRAGQPAQDEHNLECLEEEFGGFSNQRNTHIKFLEIDLPVPSFEPVNIEAKQDYQVAPAIQLSEPDETP